MKFRDITPDDELKAFFFLKDATNQDGENKVPVYQIILVWSRLPSREAVGARVKVLDLYTRKETMFNINDVIVQNSDIRFLQFTPV